MTVRLGPDSDTIAMPASRNGIDSTTSMSRAITVSTAAAEVARDHADDHAEHHGEQRRDHADEQRDPAAVGDADEQVAAEVVGAEQERAAGRLRQALRGEADVAVLVVGAVADQRGQRAGRRARPAR